MNEWFGPVLGIMKAPSIKKAIEWQNATEFGLTAGLHSLSTKECDYWLKKVEAGNLYINRPITGAIVKRQPFGGWKKSSFGPTVKAGSSFYPNIFKRYDEVKDYNLLINDLKNLWNIKSKKIKNDDLQSEYNYSVLHPHKKVLFVQDEKPDPAYKNYLDSIKKIFGVFINEIEFSKLEDNDSLKAYTLVRWLSSEPVPEWIYKYNFSVDTNHIVQNPQKELFSWVREQSVSITNHRYGNIGFSPVSVDIN